MISTSLPPTWPGSATSWFIDWAANTSPQQRLQAIARLSDKEALALASLWELRARRDQLPPRATADGEPWLQWLVIGGRGAGKTRTGAEWVRGIALGLPGFAQKPVGRIALVGESFTDVRDVMVEGVSGILAVHDRFDRPLWEPSRRRLQWRTGAVAQCFSAEDPASLRGPQFECAWLDELAKWRQAEEVFDMLQFGLRLGDHPRQLITTTPRPVPLLKRLLADPRSVVSRARTQDNSAHLAAEFLDSVVSRYAGTRLGRQELEGELIEDRPDALWTRDMIERARVTQAPPLARIVVAVDPPAASHRRADRCGIVAAGIDGNGRIHVLADETLGAARPAAWASAAVALYHRLEADLLVAEVNQGGDMVASVIGEVDATVPVRKVRATRGKFLRAAPVAQLYEQGRVHHVGAFPALEDEMCLFGPGGLDSGRSPDRLDALVWAVTELALKPRSGVPQVRRI